MIQLTERELQALLEDNIRGKVKLVSVEEFKNNIRFELWDRAGVVYKIRVRGVLDREYEEGWKVEDDES